MSKGADPVDSDGRVLPAITFCEIHTGSDRDQENKDTLKLAWMKEIVRRTEQFLNDRYQLVLGEVSRPVQPGDIAVLMDTNGDCETMQKHLESRGISSVIYSDRRVLDTEEADLFGLFLRCLARPSDRSSLRALLVSRVFRLDASDVSRMEETGELDEMSLLFHSWKNRCDQGGLIRVFHTLFEKEDFLPGRVTDSWKNRLLKFRSGDRSCTNLLHLAELFHQEQRNRSLDAHGLFDLYVKMKNDPSSDDQKQVRLDKDGEAVQILTHHSSKGLEYPVVFFFGGMQDGKPGNRSELTYYWNDSRYRDFLMTGDSRAKAALSDWEERKRLYYVSLTRASSQLLMPFFPQSDMYYLSSIYGALCGPDLLKDAEELVKDPYPEMHWPFHACIQWRDRKGIKQKKAGFHRRIGEQMIILARTYPDLFLFSPCDQEEGNLSLFDSPEPRDAVDIPDLHCARWAPGAPFSERIIRVDSFSSLTAGKHGAVPDTAGADQDADRDGEDSAPIPTEADSGILGLTRGGGVWKLGPLHF